MLLRRPALQAAGGPAGHRHRAARTARSAASSARPAPLGVHTVAWKAPSEEERAHDYLWRIHKEVPRLGEIMIFNRSHYEDVLVPPVKGWITTAQTRQRYAHINDFERMLAETGTVVLKFLLHISKEEQRLSACRSGSTTRPSTGSSPPATSRSASLGRVPGRLRRSGRRHRHALGAVDHRPGRLEDASQPDDRRRRQGSAGAAEAALSAGRPGALELRC